MFGKKKKQEVEKDENPSESFLDTTRIRTGDEEPRSDLSDLENQPEWIDEEQEEGQLSVDVYQEGDDMVVKSTIAGIEPENIDISLTNDMLTIRGERRRDVSKKDRHYFFEECYWGSFSRSIILPVEVDIKKIDATIKNGILTITLPIIESRTKKKISVKDDE